MIDIMIVNVLILWLYTEKYQSILRKAIIWFTFLFLSNFIFDEEYFLDNSYRTYSSQILEKLYMVLKIIYFLMEKYKIISKKYLIINRISVLT